MGVFYETLPPSLQQWVLNQKCFWVATAPLSSQGHINVSPKGGPYFGVIDERTFWYQDLSGSGSETICHLHEPGNGRIVIMLNAFDGPPKIVRLWGKGRVLERGTSEYDTFVEENKVETLPGTRSMIIVDIHQVGSSCGFSVPYYDFKEHRPILNDFYEKKHKKFLAGDEKESIDRYWAFKNAWSMDGLPAMKRGLEVGKQENVTPIKKMVGPLAPKNGTQQFSDMFTLQQVVIIFIVAFIAGVMAASLSPNVIKDTMARIPRQQQSQTWMSGSFK